MSSENRYEVYIDINTLFYNIANALLLYQLNDCNGMCSYYIKKQYNIV